MSEARELIRRILLEGKHDPNHCIQLLEHYHYDRDKLSYKVEKVKRQIEQEQQAHKKPNWHNPVNEGVKKKFRAINVKLNERECIYIGENSPSKVIHYLLSRHMKAHKTFIMATPKTSPTTKGTLINNMGNSQEKVIQDPAEAQNGITS